MAFPLASMGIDWRCAVQVFEQMQAENISASEVTYGCLLVACERLGDVDRAFLLYKKACQQGIAPSDECHNILVNVCTATGRSAVRRAHLTSACDGLSRGMQLPVCASKAAQPHRCVPGCRLHEALELVKDMARSHRYKHRPEPCVAQRLACSFRTRLSPKGISTCRSQDGQTSSIVHCKVQCILCLQQRPEGLRIESPLRAGTCRQQR